MKEALFAQTSVIILSAGSSVRMGTHKALLKFETEKTFLQKITETYSLAGIEQIIVVVNAELHKLINKSESAFSEKVMLIINDKPELGRFYSLQTGIKHVKPGNNCFFQNIDNPFTTVTLLHELIIYKDEADVLLPAFQNRAGHPVLISPLVVQKILQSRNSDLRIDMFLITFKVKRVEASDSNILANINSPEDFARLTAGLIFQQQARMFQVILHPIQIVSSR